MNISNKLASWLVAICVAMVLSGCNSSGGGQNIADAATSSSAVASESATTTGSGSTSNSGATSGSSSNTNTNTPTTKTTANVAPTIGGNPVKSLTVGSAYSFTPVASDANGDALAFSISNKPSWASFNTVTGALTGTPSASGSYANVLITVSDGKSSASLASFTINVAAAAAAGGSATLSWAAPTQNTDGTQLMDLNGYRIYYGTSADNLNSTVNVAASATSYTISGLVAGTTYYFAIAALNAAGVESSSTEAVSKLI